MIRLLNLWINSRLAASIGVELSCEVYRRTLNQPYCIHVNRNTSSVIATLTTEVSRTINALKAFLQLITSIFVSLGILIGLLLVNPLVTLCAVLFFSVTYGLPTFVLSRELRSISKNTVAVSRQLLKSVQEGLGSTRYILLDNSQSIFCEKYRSSEFLLRRYQARNDIISSSPRFIVEALGIVFIGILGAFLAYNYGDLDNVIPLLGALALGSQRLLPALQQIYSYSAFLKGSNSQILSVLEMLDQPLPASSSHVLPLNLNDRIEFKDVSFSYNSSRKNVLNSLNLNILRGERIGIIGSTGSGKSTMVDLFMGLLEPTSGQILIDGRDLHDLKNPDILPSWRSIISHVPQSIFLTDGSIAENIAFGVPVNDIDLSKVKLAAEQAHIASFIESLPAGYSNFVGERGIQLSGGQRQRIAIARALYKRSQVLVFDEATSALDNTTESSVMNAIEDLGREYTTIIIAHRISTLSKCDRIIHLCDGSATISHYSDSLPFHS